MKRTLSMLLVLAMLLSCLPMGALATEVETEPAETIAQTEEVTEAAVEETAATEAVLEAAIPVAEPEPLVSTYSITQDEYGFYYFSTFEELRELASESYDSITGANYAGSDVLEIKEDISLPDNFALWMEEGSLYIPSGVTFAAQKAVQVGQMTVDGTANVMRLTIYDSLEVNGKLVSSDIISMEKGAALTGEDNIAFTQEWGSVHRTYEVTDIISLKQTITRINDNVNSRRSYSIDFVGDVVITETVTIPAFISGVSVWDSLTVKKDVTLTLDTGCGVGGVLNVEGTLVNNLGISVWVYADDVSGRLNIASGGKYNGTGIIEVYSDVITEPSSAISGLNMADFQITEYDMGYEKHWELSAYTENDSAPDDSDKFVYLEDLEIVASDRYTGNQGDSFINVLGTNNGCTDIHGNQMLHGLEAWIARWNFRSELSWAWAEYAINGQYSLLSGKATIISDCYNSTNFDSTLEIIGDGSVLYSTRLLPDMDVININVDISGVNILRIYVYDNVATEGGTSFGLWDFSVCDNNDIGNVEQPDDTPDNKKENGMVIFSDYTSLSVSMGSTITLGVGILENGSLISELSGITFQIEDNSILKTVHIENENCTLYVKLHGLREGNTTVFFNNSYTNEIIAVPITVYNRQSHAYALNNIPVKYIEKYPTNIYNVNGLYIDNYEYFVNADQSARVKFDVYNSNYAYSSVEVYKENGDLYSVVLIDKAASSTTSMKSVLWDGTKYFVHDLYDGDLGTYRQESGFSKKTSIDIIIPQNGYIKICTDSNASLIVGFVNAIDVLMQIKSLAGDLENFGENSYDFSKKITLKLLAQDSYAQFLKDGNKLSNELWKNLGRSVYISPTAIGDLADTVAKNIDELKLGGILQETAFEYGWDVGQNVFTHFTGYIGKSLDIIFLIGKGTDLVIEIADIVQTLDTGYIYIQNQGGGIRSAQQIKVESKTDFSEKTALNVFTVELDIELLDKLEMINPELHQSITEGTTYTYNISLLQNGAETQPDGTVTVYIPIPENLKLLAYAGKAKVFRTEEDGTMTEMNTKIQDGCFVFTTDHFSLYTIVGYDSFESDIHVHNYTEQITEPTCTERGYTTYTCTCGESYKDNDVEAKGHTEAIDEAINPTCTEPGKTEGKHCSVCGEVLTKQEEIPAIGHKWDNGKVTKEPTATEDGVKTFTCTACGETKEEPVPATGEEILWGDASGDGRVNAMDATRILRYAAKLITEDKIDLIAADVNSDGRVNAMDATRILRYAAKLIAELKVQK